VRAQLDHADASVPVVVAPANEAAAGCAVDEPADVRAVAAKGPGDIADAARTDHRRAEQLSLLRRQLQLAAGPGESVVERYSETAERARDRRRRGEGVLVHLPRVTGEG